LFLYAFHHYDVIVSCPISQQSVGIILNEPKPSSILKDRCTTHDKFYECKISQIISLTKIFHQFTKLYDCSITAVVTSRCLRIKSSIGVGDHLRCFYPSMCNLFHWRVTFDFWKVIPGRIKFYWMKL